MLLHQVMHDEPKPPRRLNDRIPRDLETICLKSMAKEPTRRYDTARELAEDLQRHLDGKPIQARPVGRIERAWRWYRRNPSLAAVSALAMTALVCTAAIAIIFAIEQSRFASEQSRAARMERSLRSDLTKAFVEVEKSLIQVKSERDKANQERRAAQQSAAGMAYERGRSLSEQGNASHGMLWMARALGLAPTDDPALQHFIRASLGSWRPVLTSLRWEGSISAGPSYSARLSPDHTRILIIGSGSAQNSARLWSVSDGAPIGRHLTHKGLIEDAAFSPNGMTILTGSRDGTARLWRVADGSPIGKPLIHGVSVSAVAFSPDGKTVATADWSHTARLWRATDGTPIGQPMVHQASVHALAFSPNGKTIVTGSWDRTARLWRVADCSPIGKPMTHEGSVDAIAFSPDSQTILTGDGRRARLWRAADGSPVGQPMIHEDSVRSVAFGPDGKTILTRDGRRARLWRAADGSPVGQPMVHQSLVQALAFSPDGKTVATVGGDKTTRLWRVSDGLPIGQPMTHQDQILQIAFSPDGQTVLTFCNDHTAQLWMPASTVVGDARRVTVWVQMATGLELGAVGASHPVDDRRWHDLSSQLTPLGGPPVWAVPLTTVDGDPRRIITWVQVMTGLELDENGAVRFLDPQAWQDRRRLLDELGGPPMP
jgi:WD40 repeat protein